MTARWYLWILGIFWMGYANLNPAWAARPARVSKNGVELYESPNREAPIRFKLRKDIPLAISNLATEGFYKVRTPSGEIGWIQIEDLTMAEVLEEPLPSQEWSDETVFEHRRKKGRSFSRIRFRGLFGMALFNSSGINTQIGVSAVSNGFFAGSELHYLLDRAVSIFIRGEYDFKSAVAADQSGNSFSFSVNSFPVYLGGTFWFLKDQPFVVGISLMGGVGLGTRFVVTDPTITSGENRTILDGLAYGGAARLEINYFVTSVFALTGEFGYRYLTTARLTPGTYPSTGTNLLESNGSFVPLPVDLSGLFFSGGVTFQF